MNQDDFGYYYPEPEDRTNFRKSKTTDYSIRPNGGFAHNVTAIWGWNGTDDDFDVYGDIPPVIPTKEIKCECGSDTIKALRHSHWCPKYKRTDNE